MNHFENNVTSALTIKNTAGGGNIYGFRLCGNYLYKDPASAAVNAVVIGTDATGTTINGGTIAGNIFNNVPVTFIGNGKLLEIEVGSNTLAGTAAYGAQDGSLPTGKLPAHYGMPMFRDLPNAPWGSGDTGGSRGEIRWSGARGWLKTGATASWRQWQIGYITDATTPAGLPPGATPSTADLLVCTTANVGATSVTALLGGFVGQQLIVIGADAGNTTFTDGANLQLAGGANFTLGNDDTLHLVCVNGIKWVEISRSDN
jgi:hypothetical protein